MCEQYEMTSTLILFNGRLFTPRIQPGRWQEAANRTQTHVPAQSVAGLNLYTQGVCDADDMACRNKDACITR